MHMAIDQPLEPYKVIAFDDFFNAQNSFMVFVNRDRQRPKIYYMLTNKNAFFVLNTCNLPQSKGSFFLQIIFNKLTHIEDLLPTTCIHSFVRSFVCINSSSFIEKDFHKRSNQRDLSRVTMK